MSSAPRTSAKDILVYTVAILGRAIIVYILTMPSLVAFSWFSNALTARITLHFLTLLLAMSCVYNAAQGHAGDPSFKLLLAPTAVLTASLVSFHVGVLPDGTFTRLLGVIGLFLTQGIAMLTILAGKARSPLLQRVCVVFAILSPLVLGVLALLFDPSLYRIGTVISNVCSWTNFLYNKSSLSVGLPPFFRSTSIRTMERIDRFREYKAKST